MSNELTNLLPAERRQALRQDYFLRLATLSAILITILVIAHGVLLVPSYLYLEGQILLRRAHVEELSQNRAVSGYQELADRLESFGENVTRLLELRTVPQATPTIRAVLDLPHSGIALTSFAFTPPAKDVKGKLILTGTASTRDSLRRYNLEVAGLSFVETADLPLSAYAKESDIPFTITAILKPLP